MTKRERVERDLVIRALREHAQILAHEFDLPLKSIEAERANVKRRYGVCYEDGSIKIRLRHLRTRELLKYSSLIDTLCHKLAHLRHFDHGAHFERLYRRILERARRLGIYRPTPRRAAPQAARREVVRVEVARVASSTGSVSALPARPRSRPVQLDLFR